MVKTKQFRNIAVRYSDEGKGKAIVFLHGFTESLDIWNSIAASLSQTNRVLCIDLPGHGETPCFSEKHLMDDMADCVYEIISDLPEYVMIGHSLGGYVTLAFAEKYPDKLAGLALFHSTAVADDEIRKADRLRTAELVKNDKRKFIADFIPGLFASGNREKLKGEVEKIKSLSEKTSSEGIVAALLGMRERPDRRHVLKKSPCPVLFLPGKFDERMPLEGILSQIMLPPKSLTVVLQNSGHMGFMEEPDESLLAITQFCNLCFLP